MAIQLIPLISAGARALTAKQATKQAIKGIKSLATKIKKKPKVTGKGGSTTGRKRTKKVETPAQKKARIKAEGAKRREKRGDVINKATPKKATTKKTTTKTRGGKKENSTKKKVGGHIVAIATGAQIGKTLAESKNNSKRSGNRSGGNRNAKARDKTTKKSTTTIKPTSKIGEGTVLKLKTSKNEIKKPVKKLFSGSGPRSIMRGKLPLRKTSGSYGNRKTIKFSGSGKRSIMRGKIR
jgi:hypothetical protein